MAKAVVMLRHLVLENQPSESNKPAGFTLASSQAGFGETTVLKVASWRFHGYRDITLIIRLNI